MAVDYDLKSVKMPRLTGAGLKILATLLESPFASSFLAPSLLRDAGITAFRKLSLDEAPTFKPLYTPDAGGSVPSGSLPTRPESSQSGFHYHTIHDYENAYRNGTTTPLKIAESFLEFAKASNQSSPPMRGMIAINEKDVLNQAAASTIRWQQGKPLSPVDGVPIPIKDELDQTPYPTRVGTRVLGRNPASQDSTAAARLRLAGALLVGKANMHEIGIGVTGLNPHHGTARNPHNPAHFSGGSSSGPAVVVAAGLAPVAIGADGGGSIRIPSAFCGLVGLKATYGRISEFGAAPLCWSVAHVGPLANCAADAAQAYALIAGPDPLDTNTLLQPDVSLAEFDRFDLHDLRIGVYWPWFRHASGDVVAACEKMVSIMENAGAKIIPIEIPGLEAIRVAHLITIASEMLTAIQVEYSTNRQDFGLDVRTNLALAGFFSASDYVLAQKVRTQAIGNFMNILKTVDVIVTPSTGLPAPVIPPDALPDGESDLTTLAEIMRFAAPANLTGLPAISFPVGYSEKGLPIGFQVMGRPWNEHTLLRLAHFAEQYHHPLQPGVFWDLWK